MTQSEYNLCQDLDYFPTTLYKCLSCLFEWQNKDSDWIGKDDFVKKSSCPICGSWRLYRDVCNCDRCCHARFWDEQCPSDRMICYYQVRLAVIECNAVQTRGRRPRRSCGWAQILFRPAVTVSQPTKCRCKDLSADSMKCE